MGGCVNSTKAMSLVKDGDRPIEERELSQPPIE